MIKNRVRDEELDFLDDMTCVYQGSPFTGISCEYWPSGKLRCEISYIEGVQEGQAIEWYESGPKKGESEHHNNNFHGCSREWYENGQLKSEDYYEYSIELSHKAWSQDGTLLEAREIEEGSSSYHLLEKWRDTNI